MDSGAVELNSVQGKEEVLLVAEEMIEVNKALFNNKLDIYLTGMNIL